MGMSVWLIGLGGVLIGGVIYWVAALVLRAPEARALPSLVRR